MPASVCSKAGSIERISDGTSRPVHPTSSIPAQARAAAIAVRVTMGCGHVQMLAASCRDCPNARPGRYRRAMARATTTGPQRSRPQAHDQGRHTRRPHAGRAERRPVLRPRRQRDLGGTGREPWHGSRTRSVPAAGTSRSSRRSGAAGPACGSGNWKKAIHRRGRPSPMPLPILRGGVRKDAVMKIATNYFEDRREALFDVLGPQMMADVIGYHAHRDSIQAVLRAELTRAAKAAGGRPVLPGGAQPRRDRPRGPPGDLARGAGRGVRDRRVAGAAALHVRRDPVDAVRRGRPAAPGDAVAQHLRQPRLPVIPCRASCSGARMGSPASSTCASGRARTSRSRTAPTGISIRCGTPSPRRSAGDGSSR